MVEIESENIKARHRNEYHRIYIFDDRESVLVEDRRWMPRFMSRDHPASETKSLYARVPSCDDATIQSIKNQIGSK